MSYFKYFDGTKIEKSIKRNYLQSKKYKPQKAQRFSQGTKIFYFVGILAVSLYL